MPKGVLKNYKAHPGQRSFHDAVARGDKEILVSSSIRSGKTYAIIHETIRLAWNHPSRGMDGLGLLLCAPTYRLLSTVDETPIVNKLNSIGILREHSYSKHQSILKNGNIIYYRSLEEPDTALRGLNIHTALVDESAYCSEYAIDVVKGRLLTTGGQLIMITSPTGINSWFYDKYIKNPLPSVTYLEFNILQNPIITEEAVQRLKESYDSLLYQQEVEGKWVNLTSDSVYYSFSDDNIKDIPFDKNVIDTHYIGLDYNVDINAMVFILKLSETSFYVYDEMVGLKTTYEVGNHIKNKYPLRNYILVDDSASGIGRQQSTGETNRSMLNSIGIHNIVEARSNPGRMNRVSLVNALLKNANNGVSLFIHPRCTNLINDLRSLTYKKHSNEFDTRGETLGHITAALGYVIYYLTDGGIKTTKKPLTRIEEIKQRSQSQNEYF